MKLSFDHLVHFTKDPHQIVTQLQEQGLHAVRGGRHECWGTYNGLCYFDLSYIELLGVEDMSIARQVEHNGLISQVVEEFHWGEGLASVGLRTDNIDELYRQLKEKGLRVGRPVPGSRKREDGTLLKWSMLFAEEALANEQQEKLQGKRLGNLRLPFFIQWEQSEEERRKDLSKANVLAKHPRGDLQLAYVACAVRNLEERVHQWQTWFDVQVGQPFEDNDLQAVCQKLIIPGGNIIFCAPIGEGVAQSSLEKQGERPFLVALHGADEAQQIELAGGIYKFFKI